MVSREAATERSAIPPLDHLVLYGTIRVRVLLLVQTPRKTLASHDRFPPSESEQATAGRKMTLNLHAM